MLKGGFSLKIQKRETNKVQKVVKRGFEKIEEETDNAEIIKGIDSEKGIIGTKPKVEEKALVIPCIKVNKWNALPSGGKKSRVEQGAKKANEKQFTDSTDDAAVKEILADTNRFMEQAQNGDDTKNLNIPLMAQNRVPEGTETEDGPLKVDIRPESSTLDDYDAVPISAFGLGMLRGMGWKEEEGIGKTKQKIDEFKTTVRPKGLGLGAIPVQKKKEKIKEESQQLQMRVGAYVKIIDGPYKDQYGRVTAMDGDLGRVTVKWALAKLGPPTEVNEIFTEVVSKTDHDKIGKDISRKARQEYDKKLENDKKKDSSNGSEKSNGSKKKAKSIKPSVTKWVHIGLIVQYVADKKSKHFKEKFEVRKVRSRAEIICRNIDTRKEYDFHERDLQTVVPKNQGEMVMVLTGSLSGTFGKIIERSKEKDRVTLEMINRHSDIERVDFDNVCQFNGTHADFC